MIEQDRWGMLCTSGIDAGFADVACRQLGYASGIHMQYSFWFDPWYSEVQLPMAAGNATCRGDEPSLTACTADPTPSDACLMDSLYATLLCKPAGKCAQ